MNNLTIVILAAGLGTRLGEITKNNPKILTLVCGRSIIEYSISWAKLFNPKKIIIVGGYKVDKLKEKAKNLDKNIIIVENKNYIETQRMASLICAKTEINGDLLIFDGDYIYHKKIAEKVGLCHKNISIFATDDRSEEVDFDMAIKVDKNGNLIEMAKGLKYHDYFFNSITFCPEKKVNYFFNCANDIIKKIGEDKAHVEDALVECARLGEIVKVIDVGYPYWIEIDNQQELKVAEKMINKDRGGFIY
jgi:choline kinase